MASNKANNPVSPALEAKFKAIAHAQPPLSVSDLARRLAVPPTADLQTYARWLLKLSISQEKDKSKAQPSNHMIRQLIGNTKFDDVSSLDTLYSVVNGVIRLEPFNIGSFTAGQEKIYLIVDFCSYLLPLDEEPRYDLPRTSRTSITTEPSTEAVPRLFFQLGRLFRATSATESLQSATATEWVVIVTPARDVYVLWNPNGSTIDMIPELYAKPNAYKTRKTAGSFPGFANPCTLVSLSKRIDNLLSTDVAANKRTLTIRESDLITLPRDTKLKFTAELTF